MHLIIVVQIQPEASHLFIFQAKKTGPMDKFVKVLISPLFTGFYWLAIESGFAHQGNE